MGPIRGFKRRKKAADKKVVDQNVLPSFATVASTLGSQPQPLDWWDEFSKRISGNIITFVSLKFLMFKAFDCVIFSFYTLPFLLLELLCYGDYKGSYWLCVMFNEIS